MTYAEKFKDPKWQKKRLKILERDEWSCQKCYDKNETLHVHHRRYIQGRDPWDYPDSVLITLCKPCHEHETENLDECSSDLISIIKDAFFSDSIRELAEAFHGMRFFHVPEVVVSTVCWILTDENAQRAAIKSYFQYLSRKKENA